ncbi:hypothetical protein AB0392_43070, partial [Nonomuraea angiospora]
LRAEPDLSMTIYAAEPGSPSEDALRLLASWAATHERTDRPPGRRPSAHRGHLTHTFLPSEQPTAQAELETGTRAAPHGAPH